jgi:hypothetical protein
MEQQFNAILKPRLDDVQKRIGGKVAQLFSREMKKNVENSEGFGGDQFDSKYSQRYLKERIRKGHPKGKVILKAGNRRINQTQIQTTEKESNISFSDGGWIFQMHHEGTAKGGKTRSIWPKTPESIPKNLKSEIKTVVGEVLRGQK